jgi:TRAP transporter TAXI family solute receptor
MMYAPAVKPRFAFSLLLLFLAACNPQGSGSGKVRLSIATGGTGGVYYPYGGGIAKIISENIPNVEATAEVTAASVDNLKFLRDRKADIAFVTADTLYDAVEGRGVFEGTKLPIRALASLYENYTQVVTLDSSPVKTLTDMKGKVISVGSAGSGTEVTAFRVLEAAGINPSNDIHRQGLGVVQSVDALKDGKIDAFFFNGGLPTAAILDLAHTPGFKIRMISNAEVLEGLHRTYGESLYALGKVPAGTYAGVDTDTPVVSIMNILAVHESMPEQLAFDITRTLFQRQADLVAIHPEAKKLSLQSAVKNSPAMFHPGAIRYYKEQGAWTE